MKRTLSVLAVAGVSSFLSAAEVAWTGAGADALMTTEANWASPVDLADGTLTARFSEGTEALAAGSHALYGIVFGSAAAFTLGAAESGSIALGAGGLAATTKGPYTVSAPVEITADQTWDLTKSSSLTISGPLNSDGVRRIQRAGSGTLRVSGGGNFTGDIHLGAAGIELHGYCPFGTGAGTITLTNKDSVIVFDGTVVAKDILVDPRGTWGKTGISVWAPRGESVMKGKVTYRGGNFYIRAYGNGNTVADVTFEGGVACAEDVDNGYLYLALAGGESEGTGYSSVVFTNKPVNVGEKTLTLVPTAQNKNGICCKVTFAAPGNVMNSLGHTVNNFWSNSEVYTTVDWAFDREAMAVRLANDTVWDLCGTSQRVGPLCFYHKKGNAPVVTNSSDKTAVLYFKQSADWEHPGVFGGKLDVVMSGSKTLTVGKPMTAVGDLTVNGGTLAFTAGGSWRNARTVAVDGGKITLASGDVFSRDATLSLAAEESFAIAAGEDSVITQTVSELSIGGERKPHGCYPAGAGVLEVLYDRSKTVTDGVLTLAAGETFVLDEYTLLSSSFSGIVLGAGSTLTVSDASFVSGDIAYTLVVGEDAKLVLPDGTGILASSVTSDGVALSPGRHDDLDWLEGGAGVYIPFGETEGTDVTWTGQGADTSMATAGNWSGPVDLSGGTSRAVFASGGSEATVSGDVRFNGMEFNAANGFALTSSGGDALIRLGSGGVTTSGGKSHTVSVPLKIEADQTWALAADVRVPLTSDPLSRYTLVKTGSRSLSLDGDGSYSGSLSVESGGLIVYGDDALGAGGEIAMNSSCGLTAAGAVIDKPITFASAPDGVWGNATRISVWGDRGDSVFNGKVSFGAGNFYTFMYCNGSDRSRVVFAGGLEGDSGYPYFDLTGGGSEQSGFATVVFTNSPVAISRNLSLIAHAPNKDGLAGRFVFSAPGNKLGALGHPTHLIRTCEVQTTVDWAFDDAGMPLYFGYNALWDLCGTRQRVGHLNMSHPQDRVPVITNSHDAAATLFFTQTADAAPSVVFGGNLNVDISGTKTTTIDRAMTATGELTVNGGTLAFTENGSWRGAEKVTVAGSGRITIVRTKTLGSEAEFTLESDASLEIAAGAVQRAAKLTLAGVEHVSGTFTFGEGVLKVGPVGLQVLVR